MSQSHMPMITRHDSEMSLSNLLVVLDRYDTKGRGESARIHFNTGTKQCQSVPVSPNPSQGKGRSEGCQSETSSPYGSDWSMGGACDQYSKASSSPIERRGHRKLSSMFKFSEKITDVVFFSSPSVSPKSPFCVAPSANQQKGNGKDKSDSTVFKYDDKHMEECYGQVGESCPSLAVRNPSPSPLIRETHATSAQMSHFHVPQDEDSFLDEKFHDEGKHFLEVKGYSAPASLRASPVLSRSVSPNPGESKRFPCYEEAGERISTTAPSSLTPSPASSRSISPNPSPRDFDTRNHGRHGSFPFDTSPPVTLPMCESNSNISQSQPVSPKLSTNMDARRKQLLKSRSCSKLTTASSKRQLMSSLLQMRKDLSMACKKLVAISSSMGDSVENLLQRQSSKSALFDGGVPKRRIKVIHSDVVSCSIEDLIPTAKQEADAEANTAVLEEEETRNISPGLIMTSLKNRLFSAEVSLTKIPEGEITLYVNNFQVLIISGRVLSNSDYDDKKGLKPSIFGKIDLPIYVDSKSVQFKYSNDAMLLYIEAQIKC